MFQNPLGREVRCQVFQDSINETNYYKVELLEKSPLRFKVRMQAYDFSPTISFHLIVSARFVDHLLLFFTTVMPSLLAQLL